MAKLAAIVKMRIMVHKEDIPHFVVIAVFIDHKAGKYHIGDLARHWIVSPPQQNSSSGWRNLLNGKPFYGIDVSHGISGAH
jgi:hypothetical protein